MNTLRQFFSRLWQATSGNVLVITAVAMIPLTAMIGSAVDLSRAYSAKTRLQSACDAGSLAARRIMRNDDLTTEVQQTAVRFFSFNFPQGSFNTTPFTPTVTRPSTGVVRMTAATRIPTTLMGIFGYDSIPLRVSCDASLNFVNTDVVLVLDVTGSMADPVDGRPKIEALRDAVMALYDELAPVQTQLQAQGLRLRYGIVPYSSTVNVGRLLYNVNPSYITDSTTYPSRVANFNTLVYPANPPTSTSGWEYWNGNTTGQDTPHPTATRSTSQCQTWVQSAAVNGGGPAPTATTQTTYSGTSTSTAYVASQDWGWAGAPVTSGTNRSCRRWRTVTTTTYQTRRDFTSWTYRQETYDTSLFKQPGGTMVIATDANGTVANPGGTYNLQQLPSVNSEVGTRTATWNGCIEERNTTTSINGGTSLTIPADAFDLDINRIPDSNATRWRPMLPEVVYTRTQGSTSTSNTTRNTTSGWILNNAYSTGFWACPTEARRLNTWTRTGMENYVNSLQPIGGTYLDIGMLWGARFISTGGVFADGCTEYNGMPCNRHIIFMTDGKQTAYCNVLTAYGIEQNDMRVTGSTSCSTSNQLARHQQRLRMICNAAKNMNVSVWVIGFDTTINADVRGCASNAAQASVSSSSAALIAKFREIGNQIGALRLVK